MQLQIGLGRTRTAPVRAAGKGSHGDHDRSLARIARRGEASVERVDPGDGREGGVDEVDRTERPYVHLQRAEDRDPPVALGHVRGWKASGEYHRARVREDL